MTTADTTTLTAATTAFALSSAGDPDRLASSHQPVLTGVQADGRLEGVLFTLHLHQTYRNPCAHPLALVYAFALPSEGVLLGFAATVGGRRLEGSVLPRRAAERRDAAAPADAGVPVRLDVADDGLHRSHIGMLLPGQQITVELRIAQLLRFAEGRLRLVIPATIAPPCGLPAAVGLPPPLPGTAPESACPLALSLLVAGSLADGQIDCTTHSHAQTRSSAGMLLQLAPGAAMDRDLVVLVTPPGPERDGRSALGLVTLAADAVGARSGAGQVALAAFQTPAGRARPRARIQLLLDCAGAMAGDGRLASAQRALHGVLGGLQQGDALGFNRCGSRLDRRLPLAPVTPASLAAVRRALDATRATPGGTRLAEALATLILDQPPQCGRKPAAAAPPAAQRTDILLITGGEVSDIGDVVGTALATGQRVFAIGIGSAPAGRLLHRLAEASGGACEFALPGAPLEAAALRMLARIRQGAWSQLRVDWRTAPAWQLPLQATAYGGDTVLALAGFLDLAPPGDRPTLYATAEDGSGQALAVARTGESAGGDTVARVAAARRLPGLGAAAALHLALDHGLVSAQTRCVLLQRRADAEPARLRRVDAVLAAGWDGGGPVPSAAAPRRSRSAIPPGAVAPDDPIADPQTVRSQVADLIAASRATAPLQRSALPPSAVAPGMAPPAAARLPSLRDWLVLIAGWLERGLPLEDLQALRDDSAQAELLRDALRSLDWESLDWAESWLLLALWVALRPEPDGDPALAAQLAPHAVRIEASARRRALALLELVLGDIPSGSWTPSLPRRLAGALRRTGT